MGEVVRLPASEGAGAPETPEALWRELVGEQLRRTRLARGERLVDVARRAGVSTQYLSEVERGLKDPSSEMLQAIAGALHLTVRGLASRAVGTPGTVDSGGAPAGPLCLAV